MSAQNQCLRSPLLCVNSLVFLTHWPVKTTHSLIHAKNWKHEWDSPKEAEVSLQDFLSLQDFSSKSPHEVWKHTAPNNLNIVTFYHLSYRIATLMAYVSKRSMLLSFHFKSVAISSWQLQNICQKRN